MQIPTQDRTEKISDEIAFAGTRLLSDEPFYGHLFARMQYEITEKVKRVALVTSNQDALILQINPSYWESLDRAQHTGVIKHQLLHLAFKHPARRPQFENKKLFDLACDIIVNQYLKPDQITADAVTVLDVGLPRGQSLDYYYHHLMLQEIHRHCVLTTESGPLSEHDGWIWQAESLTTEFASRQIDQLVAASTKYFSACEHGKLPAKPACRNEAQRPFNPVAYWKRIFGLLVPGSGKTDLIKLNGKAAG